MYRLMGPSGAAAGWCRPSAPYTDCLKPRHAVVAFGLKRAKQYVPRKELQKQAKQEYLKQLYEGADRIEGDYLVYELKPSSPRVRAQQQQTLQHVQFNRQLAEQIPQLQDWQQLHGFIQQHAEVLNYLNVIALAGQAAAVYQDHGPPSDNHEPVLHQLAVLILEASSWFQPVHFTAAAVAMGACQLYDPALWNNLVAAAEHKVGAFTFQQLAQVLQTLATVGFTPHLQWVERSYRQALKHLHAADAGDVCSLMWAWGEMGYTPRDRLFMNQVKIITRRAFDSHELSGQQLVMLMHGISRMPRYAPNTGWLQALLREVQRDLRNVTPGDLVDLLLSLTVLGFQPTAKWVAAAARRLQQGLTSSNSITTAAEPLMLLLTQEQLQGPAGIQTAGMLVDRGERYGDGLQQLQQLLAEAEATDSDDADEAEHLPLQQQQQQQSAGMQQPLSPSNMVDLSRTSSGSSAEAAGSPLQLTVEQLGVLCWCIGRLDHRPGFSCMQQICLQLLKCSPQAPTEVLVDALQGLVAVGCFPVGQLQHALLDRATELVPSMPPEALVRLCQSVVSLEQQLEQQQGGSRWLQQYQQQHKMQLAAAVAHRQGIILWQSSCQQLADVLAYLAASGIRPSPEYMATAVNRAIAKLQEQGAPASSLCTLVWALAISGFKPHPQQLHQLLAALQRGLHLLGSQDLANIGWGLCTLKHRPGTAWLGLYMRQVAAKAAYMTPQALTDTLWALACFAAQPDREWLKLILQAVLKQVDNQGLTQKNAAVVMWALCQLGYQPQLFVQPSAEGTGSGVAGGGDVLRAVEGLVQLVSMQPQPNSKIAVPAAV